MGIAPQTGLFFHDVANYFWKVGSAILTILDCMLTRYGAGRLIQTLTLADIQVWIQPQDILAYTVRLIYQLVLSGTKLGICFFYLRLFLGRNSRYIIFGLIALIVFFTIPFLLVQIFQCKPVTNAWAIFDANCPVDELTIVYVTRVFNIYGDTFLVLFNLNPNVSVLAKPRDTWPLASPILTHAHPSYPLFTCKPHYLTSAHLAPAARNIQTSSVCF
jgi:uncharacterized membrane protein